MCNAALTSCYHTLILPMSTSRSALHRDGKKLVLAFDVGTTYSGISYRCAILLSEANGRYNLIRNLITVWSSLEESQKSKG